MSLAIVLIVIGALLWRWGAKNARGGADFSYAFVVLLGWAFIALGLLVFIVAGVIALAFGW